MTPNQFKEANVTFAKDQPEYQPLPAFRNKLPLEMIWQPKEDITTYELAMCLPYFFRQRPVMPYEIDKSLPHFRHFKITDHNVQ